MDPSLRITGPQLTGSGYPFNQMSTECRAGMEFNKPETFRNMTDIPSIFADKSTRPGEKSPILSGLILSGDLTVEELLHFADGAKDPQKASCIEALETASASRPSLITQACFAFVTASLKSQAPRVKWESARVIANAAHLFPAMLGPAISNLLDNTEHPGTVVRWSAATALAAVVKVKSEHNAELVPAIGAIMEREEKNSIRKIYAAAIKKNG